MTKISNLLTSIDALRIQCQAFKKRIVTNKTDKVLKKQKPPKELLAETCTFLTQKVLQPLSEFVRTQCTPVIAEEVQYALEMKTVLPERQGEFWTAVNASRVNLEKCAEGVKLANQDILALSEQWQVEKAYASVAILNTFADQVGQLDANLQALETAMAKVQQELDWPHFSGKPPKLDFDDARWTPLNAFTPLSVREISNSVRQTIEQKVWQTVLVSDPLAQPAAVASNGVTGNDTSTVQANLLRYLLREILGMDGSDACFDSQKARKVASSIRSRQTYAADLQAALEKCSTFTGSHSPVLQQLLQKVVHCLNTENYDTLKTLVHQSGCLPSSQLNLDSKQGVSPVTAITGPGSKHPGQFETWAAEFCDTLLGESVGPCFDTKLATSVHTRFTDEVSGLISESGS
mmetsp:Transcript_4040/g.6239  ORF Transcript_4040/g.6239 Transcript_4040/m.6239 type:complete len:405 (-) Transcript_4040:296-1510(-)|eukprot:CAMPEP_0175105328 /NCGR_PEP_ID=MMETSP0086_2-20121207/10375_1 /TAXON_ID=136419 /ORGANISM="Unknown Unknown, Strain D1" /LENGTH=404 /DNA_ID=CAMNT_0016381125 /DNA_START=204 /DNA_END=1418 /DNA_ORIENTATION=-